MNARPEPAALPWLAQLEPTEHGRRLVPASSGGQITRAVRAVSADAAQWAVEVGQDVAERVAAELPEHAAEGGFDVLRMGTESTTLQLLISLSGAEVATTATSESLNGLPEFARRGLSLDGLLRGIQLGHSVIAAAFLAECARRGPAETRHEQMRALSQRMFLFFDAFSTQMAAAYRDEQERWARSDAASRLAVAEAIIHGRGESVELASRRLRYDLSRAHVAAVVWSSARTIDADQGVLHEAARKFVRTPGSEQTLVLDVSAGVVWAWSTPSGDRRSALARLARARLPKDVHAVFGDVARGVEGFRASHLDVVAAFRLLSRAPSPPRAHGSSPVRGAVTAYRDVDLVSLLLADRERAERFARAELGPLAADDSAMAQLRETLAVYLDEADSPQAAALRLQVSRNTVTFRVRRAEELLGGPIGARRQHVGAALTILAEESGGHATDPDRPAVGI